MRKAPVELAHYLGITPTYADGTSVGGCSFMLHVRHAAAAINEGLCKTVLITHGESGRSGIARSRPAVSPGSLAGQFGVSLPTGTQSLSPEFYAKLLKSRVLLGRIARDTFTVQEMGGRRVTFLDMFNIEPGTAARREEQGVMLLTRIVKTSIARGTGVVESSVMTPSLRASASARSPTPARPGCRRRSPGRCPL